MSDFAMIILDSQIRLSISALKIRDTRIFPTIYHFLTSRAEKLNQS